MDTAAFDLFDEEDAGLKRKLGHEITPRKALKHDKPEEEILLVDYKFDKMKNPLVASLNDELVISHKVRHQVALPDNYPYVPMSSHKPMDPPARIYPFTLDPFQRVAIQSIERGESVLVAAHTSAGKTVVAEYAIALSLQRKQRALSNQKYRELLAEFGDVGLMTGDVTINPDSSCLVMTTEILRSMLYRGSEVIREVSWIIYDEIHYMRDKERGLVWEESIIMLPDKVHHVFLSATIPNAYQFAEWICQMKQQPCHVVYTDYRPTPLQHYLFPSGGDGIYLAVDEKSNFREDNFQKAVSILGDNDDGGHGKWKKKKNKGKFYLIFGGSTDMMKVIGMIMKKNYHPVIVFSFSKRGCENNALQLSKMDFNNEDEKELVKSVFENAIQSLKEDDRTLPQIEHLLPLLKRGIGIHHSGLLPILKEVIEILFQEGLLKVLFATETFSIGLNMPAKTVMFTGVKKFDGKESRWLSGGEYIQMSGRAGRRGLDVRGVVILMFDEKMEPSVAKSMLKGESDPLNSAYHLTYCMMLNLMRIEGFTAEFMLESSFYQFQNSASIPQLKNEIEIYQQRFENIVITNEPKIEEYYNLRKQSDTYQKDFKLVISQFTYCVPFINAGRLIRIIDDEKNLDYGWGIVINFNKTYKKNPSSKDKDASTPQEIVIVDVLVQCVAGTESDGLDPVPCPPGSKGDFIVLPCALSTLANLSSVKLNALARDIKSREARMDMGRSLNEVMRRYDGKPPLLDPVKDMRITDDSFKRLLQKIKIVESRIEHFGYTTDADFRDSYELFVAKMELSEKMKSLKEKVSDAESVLQLQELKSRRRVLRRMGYVSESDVIETKGRVACEISSGDELLLTEMIFNGIFNDLTVEQTVSLLSCFTFDENSKDFDPINLRPELKEPYKLMKESARRIAKVSIECKIDLDETIYVGSFRGELMEVVYSWALGAKFSDICKMSDVFEGTIIRGMRRLDELLNEMVCASKSIGNTELEAKFVEGLK